MPLCTKWMHKHLKHEHKLKHWARLQYGLFLKGAVSMYIHICNTSVYMLYIILRILVYTYINMLTLDLSVCAHLYSYNLPSSPYFIRHNSDLQGLSMEDALVFWEGHFSKAMTHDQFIKGYSYTVCTSISYTIYNV